MAKPLHKNTSAAYRSTIDSLKEREREREREIERERVLYVYVSIYICIRTSLPPEAPDVCAHARFVVLILAHLYDVCM